MKSIPIGEHELRNLTTLQRNMLINHLDGEVSVTHHDVVVRNSLVKIGLLRGATSHTTRPRATVLTDRGRMALAMVLGECADALIRAGIMEQESPLQVLLRLKASRSPASPPPGRKPGRPARSGRETA